jgi:hypothetical protein
MHWFKVLAKFLLLGVPIFLFVYWVFEVFVFRYLGTGWSFLWLLVPVITAWIADCIWPFGSPWDRRD